MCFMPRNTPTTNCVFFLDTPMTLPHNPPNFSTSFPKRLLLLVKGTGENRALL